jgi:FADH2 O2-dependent halogenase
MQDYDFDVGIIGGGPGGASMAAYLAKAGLKCVVFERELFPRHHVGESLVPSSTRVFKDLDFLPTMHAAGFPKKYGAAWTAADMGPIYNHGFEGMAADCEAIIRFDERQQPGVDMNHTFHVDRSKFDLLLLQHAHKLGATVYSGVKVEKVDFSDKAAPRVQFGMGSKTFELKLRVNDPVFDQYALHGWFEGYDRSRLARNPAQVDFIFIHFLPITNTWVWQIPITETITSIGVVTQKQNFASARAEREQFFWKCLESRPELLEGVKQARRVGPLRDEGDYSYAMKQICGDGFVLVGDAARFVDPIFSTGVSIALNSARFASADIVAAAETGDFSRAKFSRFESTIRRGTNNWYEFIQVYYRLNVLFTSFILDPRYRLDVLKLLQGDVYDDEQPEVLQKMRKIVSDVESNDQHLWHKHLGTLTANHFRPAF